jgi:hypothetical protein
MAVDRDTPQGIVTLFTAVSDYATRQGFVGGVPTLHFADYGDGRGIVYGSFLFKNQGAEWRDIPARELGLEGAPPPAQGDDMQPGEALYADQSIWSANGRFRFIYQLDGNLVLYGPRMPLWASGTAGRPVGVCIMQNDGNLVIYDPGGAYIWNTQTYNNPGSRLIVQNDGNVVIYKPDGGHIWATNTETVRLGYETGNISSGWEWGATQGCHKVSRKEPKRRCPTTDPLVTVNSPVREGNFALKTTVKAGDTHLDGGVRAEVLTHPKYADFAQGSVFHYHWYTMFPDQTAFPAQNKWEVWTQWHQTYDDACCQPDLQCVYNSEKIGLEVYLNRDYSEKLWEESIKREHWYDINVFVKWSTDNSGFVELWVDGELKVKKRSHITLDPFYPPFSAYMKQGLYRDRAIQVEQSIYHDGTEFSYLPLQIVWSDVS